MTLSDKIILAVVVLVIVASFVLGLRLDLKRAEQKRLRELSQDAWESYVKEEVEPELERLTERVRLLESMNLVAGAMAMQTVESWRNPRYKDLYEQLSLQVEEAEHEG